MKTLRGAFGTFAAGCILLAGCSAAPAEDTGASGSSAVSSDAKFEHQDLVDSIPAVSNPDDTNADRWSLETINGPGMHKPMLVALGRRAGSLTLVIIIGADIETNISVRIASTAKPDTSKAFRDAIVRELSALEGALDAAVAWPPRGSHASDVQGMGDSCGSRLFEDDLTMANVILTTRTSFDACDATPFAISDPPSIFSGDRLTICFDSSSSVEELSSFVDRTPSADICSLVR